MMIIFCTILLCADIALTWHLLSAYRGRVEEIGLLGSFLSRFGFHGHLIFVAVRIALLSVFIQWGGLWALIGWGSLTLYAVINNLIVWRKLHG